MHLMGDGGRAWRAFATALVTVLAATGCQLVGATSAQAARKALRERKVEGTFSLSLTPASESLPITNKINLYLPQRFRSAGAGMPKCSPEALSARGVKGCPKKAIVGSGTSLGYTILGGQFVPEHLTLTIFNGPGGSLVTWVEGLTPVVIEVPVTGLISKPAGYGQEMSFAIPHALLEPLPGAPGWLQTLNARLDGRVGWLRTTSCPAHPWSLKTELGYANGQGLTLQARLGCV